MELFSAVKEENVELIKTLLSNGSDGNVFDKDGKTALVYAIEKQNIKIVDILLMNGVDSNITDDIIMTTPLICASQNGNTEIVTLLLSYGSDVNIVDDDGKTAIVHAMENRHIKIIEIFIKNGININKKIDNGMTLLMYASNHKADYNVVDFLIKNGANINDKDDDNWSPLLFAAKEGNLEITELLLYNGAEINHKNDDGFNALSYAYKNDDLQMIKLLVENGANYIYQKNTGVDSDAFFKDVLEKRIESNDKYNVYLCETGEIYIKTKTFNFNPAFIVTNKKNITTSITTSLHKLENINKSFRGMTLLMHACKQENVEIIKLLISNGSNINIKDNYKDSGNNALMYACRIGNLKIVELFLSKGAKVDLVNNSGDNALFCVLQFGKNKNKIIELLLLHGADINSKNNNGDTAILYECKRCRIETIEILLKGSNISLKNNKEEDVLLCTISSYEKDIEKKIKIIKLLILNGANVSNNTLLYACKIGNLKIIELLISNCKESIENEIVACRNYLIETKKVGFSWENKFVLTKKYIDTNQKFPYNYLDILKTSDGNQQKLLSCILECDYTLDSGEKCNKKIHQVYDKKINPYRCYKHSVKMCQNCISWPDSHGGSKKYDGYCARCFKRLFPADPRSDIIYEHTKEIKVRNAINNRFKGFVHNNSLYTGNCDCTHRRRIDHRKLIGNTILAIETDEFAHKGYDKKDEEIRYDDLYMIHSGKWIYIRFNPDKTIYNKSTIDERLHALLDIIEKQIYRIEQNENKELVEIIKLFY